MPRSAGFIVEKNFSKGLVTEATGLSFPENAVVDTENCVFEPTGVVSRRNGIDLEAGASSIVATPTTEAFVEYLWENVAGDGNLTFLVQQIGGFLHFYKSTGITPISQNFAGSVSLVGTVSSDPTEVASLSCQFSSGLGRLVVVHPLCEPMYVTYNTVSKTFVPVQILVQTRDFSGLQPQNVPRLLDLTNPHYYNVHNQGWPILRIQEFKQKAGVWPSSYDVWWLYKSPDANGTEIFLVDVAISGGILSNLDRGNSPAPKGSVLLSEFYQDRSAVSGIVNLPIVTSGLYRPSTTEFHAGRIFYAGVAAQDYNQKIYFTQILENTTQFGKCYQENDPTSQYTPDLLPTDGGVVSIPEAGTVYKLWSLDNSLLVFASQGVWQITGSQGIGFAANDYTVKKISSAVSFSGLSFVKVDGSPVWWSLDDIYTAAPEAGGAIAVKSLTENSIQTFFQNIPEESKRFAKGAFNNRDRVVQWLYRDELAESTLENYDYTHILNLNVTSGAFYRWDVTNPLAKLRGISVLRGQGSQETLVNVVDLGDAVVTDTTITNVTVPVQTSFTLSAKFKYSITYSTNQFSYAESTVGYVDWGSFIAGSLPFTSYFISGYRVRGDAIRKGQSNYIRLFVETTDTATQQFYFNSLWDYANTGNTGRWSSRQLLVFNNLDYDYQSKRIKTRGHGLAFQFKVESLAEKPFYIIGWSSFETANAGV